MSKRMSKRKGSAFVLLNHAVVVDFSVDSLDEVDAAVRAAVEAKYGPLGEEARLEVLGVSFNASTAITAPTKITSWRVLREDGQNCAWVNDRYVGVVSDEYVSFLEQVCPTSTQRQTQTSPIDGES